MKNYKRLKPKQFVWLDILTFFCCVSIGVLLGLYWWLRNDDILYVLSVIFIMGGLLIATTYYSQRKLRRISKFMERFVRTNELYKSHFVTERGLLFGEEKRTEHFDYYPTIYYKEDTDQNKFYIKIRLDGSLIAENFRNLELPLADMFETICIEKIEEQGYLIYVFQLHPDEQLHLYSKEDILKGDKNEIIIAKDICWNFINVSHCLVTGSTGCGKSYLIQYFMDCMLEQGVRVIYCDPKADTNMMRYIHNNPSIIYATEINDIAKVVRETEDEMRKRQIELDNIGIKEADFIPIYLFFDELIAFSMITDKNTYLETEKRINSIITMGRNKRVFFGAIMQRADTKFIDGAVRDSLNCRICMGHMSDTAYTMVFGKEFSNIKNTKHGIGAGLIYRQGIDSKPREFYAPYIHNDTL